MLEPIRREQAPVLRNLFQLYAHDFSEHVPLDLAETGRFDVDAGEQWWASDDHFPFFLRASGKLCGFALIKRGSRITFATEVMDVVEFFVVRGARRTGVGTAAARALFTAFPGAWEIRVRTTNGPALSFWSRVVEPWPVRRAPFARDGVEWDVLRIEC